MKRIEEIPSQIDSAAPYHAGRGGATRIFDRPWGLAGAMLVLLANALYLRGLDAVLDPMMSMDPFYIALSRRPVREILANDIAWGPLYAVWLRPLSLWLGDPLVVYRANAVALSVLVSLALYRFLWLRTRRVDVAAAAGVLAVLSDLNVPLFSKVSAFALAIVLVALGVSELVRSAGRRLAVVAIGVLVASYARPELYPASVVLLFLAWARRLGASWGSKVAGAAFAAVLLCAPLVLGGERLLLAFREHFAWNWVRWHGEARAVDVAWKEAFGDAASLAAALRANPSAFAHHLADNGIGALRFVVGWSLNHWPIAAPSSSVGLVDLENGALHVFGWSLLGFAWWRGRLRRHGDVAVVTAAVSLAGLFSAALIYPSPHYLVFTASFGLMWCAIALAETLPAWRWSRSSGWALAVGVLVVMLPRPFVGGSARVIPGSPLRLDGTARRPITQAVLFLRSLALAKPATVMTLGDGIGDLLGDGFHEVKAWQVRGVPLADYLRRNDVAAIVSLERGRQSFILSDPYWETLHLRPEETPYERIQVPDVPEVTVFVRRAPPPPRAPGPTS